MFLVFVFLLTFVNLFLYFSFASACTHFCRRFTFLLCCVLVLLTLVRCAGCTLAFCAYIGTLGTFIGALAHFCVAAFSKVCGETYTSHPRLVSPLLCVHSLPSRVLFCSISRFRNVLLYAFMRATQPSHFMLLNSFTIAFRILSLCMIRCMHLMFCCAYHICISLFTFIV